MLELDECNKILVTNPFSHDSPTLSQNNQHGTLTLDSSSENHPLRSRSVSPIRCSNTQSIPSVTVVNGEGEVRPRPTSARILEEGALGGGSDIIMHTVRPSDSLAGVALRYGVSIAALRRANQLWPSDPIHLRTELLIPRGDTLGARHKPIHGTNSDTTLRSIPKPTLRLSPNVLTSSFVSARNMIVSALPARMSMESLSSKASASEDLELDDLRKARAHRMSASENSSAEEGYQLSVITAPHAQYIRPRVPLSSQVPCTHINKSPDYNHIPPVGNLHPRCISSPSATSPRRVSRIQPFAILPVRTSQLEPEPAMELPVRRSRIQRSHLWMDGASHQV